MSLADAIKLAGEFGPMGLLVAYLVWSGIRADRQRDREDQWRRDHEEKRLAADQARTSADVALAKAMTGLTMLIQGRVDVRG